MADGTIKYTDIVDGNVEKGLSALEKQLEALNQEWEKMQRKAKDYKESLSSVNSATDSGRKAIKESVVDIDRLTKAYNMLDDAQSDTALEIAKLKQAQREAQNITKLNARLITSEAGSYDALSAQYSLNKIALNGLSAEERTATEFGRQLEEGTRLIYEEMKRLQSQTGKTALNVGNYADAGKSLVTTLRDQTYQLAEMRLRGEEGTKAYQDLAQSTAILKDALADTTAEIKNMASDTAQLDAILQGASAAGGGFAAYTGALELFGSGSEDVQKAQKKLQAAIAITTGLQTVQNAVQKQSALMLGISTIQTYAAAKAEAYRRLITIQGTAATKAATIAQAAFNVVASANPYVLLAVALVTVVGALVIFASNTESAGDKQKKLNDLQSAYIDLLDLESGKLENASNKRIRELEQQLTIAQARNASQMEINSIEDKIAKERRRAHAEQVGFYREEISNLDENEKKLEAYRRSLIKLNQLKAQGSKTIKWDVELDGNLSKYKIDEAIEIAQGKVDNYGRLVTIGVDLQVQGQELDTDEAVRAAERLKQQREAYKNELDLLRKAEDSKNQLIANSYDRQRATISASYTRQIADLNYQLQTENNISEKGRNAINNMIVNLREQLRLELIDISNQEAIQLQAVKRRSEDLQLSLMRDSADKQRRQLQTTYSRQIEDLQTQLRTQRNLTEREVNTLLDQILLLEKGYMNELQTLNDQIAIQQLQAEQQRLQLRLDAVHEGSQEEINIRLQLLEKQRQIELAQNRLLTIDVRQSEQDINAAYDAIYLKQSQELAQERALLLLDRAQKLAQSEFDLQQNSELKKTRFRLNAERERLEKIIELNESAAVKLSDMEVETIRNTIKKIEQEVQKARPDNIFDLFGLNLNDDQKTAIETSVNYVVSQFDKLLQARINYTNKVVSLAEKEVSAAKSALEAEIQARNNGFAHNAAIAVKELEAARENQAKALEEQEKAQQQQERLQTIQQASNLITASTLIWSQLGFPFAIPAIAAMFASFIGVKIKAAQLSKAGNELETYGEGMGQFVKGGSHTSGNDVYAGVNPNTGNDMKVEGGEFMGIVRRKYASGKYKSIIGSVWESLNNGTFEDKFINSMDINRQFNVEPADTRKIENSLIKIQNKKTVHSYSDGKYMVTTKGNITNRIRIKKQ